MFSYIMVFNILVVLVIPSQGFCEAEQDRAGMPKRSNVETQSNIFKPLYSLKPHTEEEERKTVFKQFKPEVSADQVVKDYQLNYYTRETLHPGSQPMMDLNTSNRLIQEQVSRNRGY